MDPRVNCMACIGRNIERVRPHETRVTISIGGIRHDGLRRVWIGQITQITRMCDLTETEGLPDMNPCGCLENPRKLPRTEIRTRDGTHVAVHAGEDKWIIPCWT